MEFAFGLPDPSSFPPLPDPLDRNAADRLRRFGVAAVELAKSSVLSSDSSISIRVTPQGREEVSSDLPAGEAVRGYAVLFRQFFADAEPASFRSAHNILFQAADQASDRYRDERRNQLKAWSDAHRRLRRRPLKVIAQNKLIQARGGTTPKWKQEDPSCEELINAYFYGDQIHWGNKRELLDQWAKDPFEDAFYRFQFLDSAGGLAHLYLGYSLLVTTAAGL